MSDVGAQALGSRLDAFVHRVSGVTDAVVLSSDGLLAAKSTGMARAVGDLLAAATVGVLGVARSGVRHLGGIAVNQIIVELDESYLFFMPIGGGNALAVRSAITGDVGAVGYEMSLFVDLLADTLTAEAIEVARSMLAMN